jgi:hypothetical protein
LDNKNSSSIYKFELKDNGEGGTEGKLDFTYQATNKKGNKLVEKDLEEEIYIMLSILNAMLQHYCETNEMLPSSDLQNLILAEQNLSIMDKIRMGLNRFAVSKMKDKDRGRFMKKFYGR